MVVMERKVFSACLIAIMISALIVPVNQIVADEPANLVKLTPFTISFAKEDFDKFARVHGIMWLMEGESTDLRVRIQNNEDEQHEIRFHVMNIGSTPAMQEVVSMSITPETIVVKPHSSGETVLRLNASSFVPETQQGTIGIVAKSTTFGATGEFFYLLVGNNISEYDTFFFDTAMRESAPGPITTYINKDPDFEYFENLFGFRFALPSYLPSNYTIQDVDHTAWYVRILYSPVEVTTETGFYEFFRDGGIFAIYSRDAPDFDAYLLSSSSYGSQEVMVNDFIGIAWDQREQVTVSGNQFKSESGIVLFKDNFMIELRGGVPLEELFKVAASLQYKDQVEGFSIVNTTQLISMDEQKELCCHSLALSPDGSKIAYVTSSYDNSSMPEYWKLWLHNIHDKPYREIFGTENAGSIQGVRISPNGTSLLFLNNGYLNIFSFYNGGSLVGSELSDTASADWMPDGSLVVARFVGNETVGNAYRISIYGNDGKERLLYEESMEAIFEDLRASPDGKKVAFVLDRVYYRELLVLDLESGQVKTVVPQRAMQPRWGPDSNFLLYNEILGRRPPSETFELEKNNPLGIIKLVNLAKNETSTIIRPENSQGFSDFAVTPDGMGVVYALYENDYSEGAGTTLSRGIYKAEFSQAIPEFPAVWFVLIASFFVTSMYTRNLRRTKHAQI